VSESLAVPSLCVLLENHWIPLHSCRKREKNRREQKAGWKKRKSKTNREKKWGEERQEGHTNPYLPSSTEREENTLGKATNLPII